jgi:dihydrodipicolinate synthase/N-acetylneuraminate lyase
VQFLVATVTPFDSRGRVDLGRLRAHVLWLAAQGVDGFVPTGTTGEFMYLSDREREAVHRTVLDSSGALSVYPCTWDPSPSTTAYLSDAAREQGASGILVPPPLYYTVDDLVVMRWYRELHEAAKLPILAYHNPAVINTPIATHVYTTLRNEEILAGMKDSSGDLFRLKRMSSQDPGAIYAGGEAILVQARQIPQLAGFISGLGNVWPNLCMRIYKKGELQLEEALTERATRIRKAGGLRAMKALLGMGCRMPLPEPEPEQLEGLPPAENL